MEVHEDDGSRAPNTFQYVPLTGPRPLRLLGIYPDKETSGSPIRCFMHHASLDTNIQYKALSYAWGDEEPKATIYLNGQRFQVRPNLVAALEQLRTGQLSWANLSAVNLPDEFRRAASESGPITSHCLHPTYLLWIDGICINQGDIEERNQQVAQMRYIYKNASEVIVWLGEDAGDALSAFQLLSGLADIFDMSLDDAPGFISHVVRDERYKNSWIALGNILHRPWWQRAWILQEILLARKAEVLCGRWCIPLEELLKASTCFRLCSNYMDEMWEATLHDTTFQYFLAFRTGAGHLQILNVLKIFMMKSKMSPSAYERDQWFETLLSISKNYLATDARDKIYSLFGILEEVRCTHGMCIDYDKNECDLYMRTAEVLYKRSKSLRFLSMIERSQEKNRQRNFDLPSWAPDLTIPSNMEPFLKDGHISQRRDANPFTVRELKCTFTKCSEARCTFDFSRKTLKVEGFVVDQIQTTAERYKDLIPDFSAEGFPRYGRRLCWRPPDPADESRWSTFGAEKGFQISSSSPESYSSVNDLKSAVGLGCHIRDASDGNLPTVKFTCFRSSDSGYTGMTDSAIESGDSICALLGSNVPHILRKQDDAWVRVGQCSLNGQMRGEVMSDLAGGKYKLQEFTLY